MGSGRRKPGWTRAAFGDVVRLCTERTSDPAAEGFERYVGLEHLDPGDLEVRRWGDVADGTTFTTVFRPGQVLFGKRRAYQRKVGVPDFSGVCSSDIYVLESGDDRHLLPELLPFVCQTDSFFDHAIGTSAGSLSPRTNWRSLAAYEFALPPLREQRRMAGALLHATALSASMVSLHAAAGRLVSSAAAREFAALQESSVSMVRLGSVCSVGPQSGIYKSEEFRGRGVRIVQMGELFGHDVIDDATAMDRIDVSERELTGYALTSNDLLFGRRSVVLEGAGRCTLVASLREPAVFESSVLRVTLDPRRVDSRFMFEWFRSPIGTRQMKRIVTFTTVSGIAGSDLARLHVPLPSLEAQYQVSKRLSTLRSAISGPHNWLLRCQTLFSSINTAAFGETRCPHIMGAAPARRSGAPIKLPA